MTPGSQFLFDLNTWNQNLDDLRGIDVVGIIGNAGGIGLLQGMSGKVSQMRRKIANLDRVRHILERICESNQQQLRAER